MSQKKGFFSKVGKTRIVPIGLKILIIFITIILLSNFATNFLSIQLSKKQIIISIDIVKNIINNICLGLIKMYSNKGIPIKFPNKGIKK